MLAQQDEDMAEMQRNYVQSLELLLQKCIKSIELWFLEKDSKRNVSCALDQISDSCLHIILHGLQLRKSNSSTELAVATDAVELVKLSDDFEFIRRLINAGVNDISSIVQTDEQHLTFANIEQILHKWTIQNLQSKCLNACLQAIVANKKLLHRHYNKDAFMCSDRYSTAFFICLSAFELNQSDLLSQVHTDYYKPQNSFDSPTTSTAALNSMDTMHSENTLHHKQESLFSSKLKTTVHGESSSTSWSRRKSLKTRVDIAMEAEADPNSTSNIFFFQRNNSFSGDHIAVLSSSASSNYFSDDNIRPSTSASSIKTQFSNMSLTSKSTPTTTSCESLPFLKTLATTACNIELIKCGDIKVWTDQSLDLSTDQHLAPIVSTENCAIPQSTRQRKKSTSPLNTFLATFFNSPTNQQRYSSLQNLDATVDYPLNSVERADTSQSSSIFEAFLPVYGKKLRPRPSENFFDDGASTLDYTTSRVQADCCPAIDASVAALQYIDQPTSKKTESLTVFLQNAHLSRNNTELEKENAHFQISEAIISVIEHIKWAKMEPDKQNNCANDESTISNVSDLLKSSIEGIEQIQSETAAAPIPVIASYVRSNGESFCPTAALSAEDVGLSLIAKFDTKQLPQVSSLKWLVSENDTPQNLLPMPNNTTSKTPDDNNLLPRTRGTKNWAPPRPQIIFTDHAQLNRKEMLKMQNMRCAGCGIRVALQNSDSFRYCTYLGKYHCTGCHRNQMAATPAKILKTWNFRCYPVSVFAYRLLEQMYTFPLFYVPNLNPDLYVRSKALLEARNKRKQLKFVKDFIITCRYAERAQSYFGGIPKYLTDDPDMWSLADFHEAQSKNMQTFMSELIVKCENHIFECLLCTGRGFLCTFCLRDEVIFPWEMGTIRCDRCGSCFHIKCWKAMLSFCCRCQRLNQRRLDKAPEFNKDNLHESNK